MEVPEFTCYFSPLVKWALSTVFYLHKTMMIILANSTSVCEFLEFSSVQLLSRVQLFVTPWIAALQASLSITISWSSVRLTSIESVMPSSHLILCHPLLLPPSIFPSIRVFSSESALRISGQSTGASSASASVLPMMNIQDWFPLGLTVWFPCKKS